MNPDLSGYVEQVNKAVSFLQETISFVPEIVIQLGTGLGGLTNRVEAEQIIPYANIPFFPQSTVTSHQGNLVIGSLGDKRVMILSGRVHYYEGYSTREITLPIRVMQLLGAKTLLITNASGGLNPIFLPGTIMIIRDHLNFLGENPLRGPNVDKWGPRFPDLSVPYNPSLVKLALDSGYNCGIKNVVSGVYGCIPGPSLETPAETRWLRQSGADAVGMSSVPEIITAIHGGLDVLGLSVVSNVNDPDNFQPILIEDILAAAAAVQPLLEQLIIEIIHQMHP